MDHGLTKGNVTHIAHGALDCRPVCAQTVTTAGQPPTLEKGPYYGNNPYY